MRVLLDTCIYIHWTIDQDQLSDDVLELLSDYDTTVCVSSETLRELIIQFNSGKLVSKYWKTADQMIDAIKNKFYVSILPLKEEHFRTYANLHINIAQDHKDPSDHVIIAHAITEHLPLVTEDGKFEFYKKQGLDLILNKKK